MPITNEPITDVRITGPFTTDRNRDQLRIDWVGEEAIPVRILEEQTIEAVAGSGPEAGSGAAGSGPSRVCYRWEEQTESAFGGWVKKHNGMRGDRVRNPLFETSGLEPAVPIGVVVFAYKGMYFPEYDVDYRFTWGGGGAAGSGGDYVDVITDVCPVYKLLELP